MMTRHKEPLWFKEVVTRSDSDGVDIQSLLSMERAALAADAFGDLIGGFVEAWFALDFDKLRHVMVCMRKNCALLRNCEIRDRFVNAEVVQMLIEIFDVRDEDNSAIRDYEDVCPEIIAEALGTFGDVVEAGNVIGTSEACDAIRVIERNFDEYGLDAKCRAAEMVSIVFDEKRKLALGVAALVVTLVGREMERQDDTELCCILVDVLVSMARKGEYMDEVTRHELFRAATVAHSRAPERVEVRVACIMFYLLKSDLSLKESQFIRSFVAAASRSLNPETLFYVCEMAIVCLAQSDETIIRLCSSLSIFHPHLDRKPMQLAVFKLYYLAMKQGDHFVQVLIDSNSLVVMRDISLHAEFEVRRIAAISIAGAFVEANEGQLMYLTSGGFHNVLIEIMECGDVDVVEASLEGLLAIAIMSPNEINRLHVRTLIDNLSNTSERSGELVSLIHQTMQNLES